MRIESEVKLDFKDVLIRPKRSTLKSRSEVSLTRTFQLKHARRSLTCTPIIAANMDTTGTFPMATALARVGALTAVHKHYTPEEWVAWAEEQRLAAARAAAGIIMEDGSHPEPEDADDARMPPAAAAAATAPAASATAAGAVDGIADGATRPSPRAPRLRPTLTPRSGTYTHSQGTYTPLGGAHRALASAVTVTTAATLTLPALAAVAVSAGTAAADLARVRAVTQAVPEVGLLCLDVANGYSEGFVDTVRHYRDEFPSIAIMAGNVVTGEMVEELVLSGADIIKVGIGPGSVCTTRKKTGVGYPQLSAVIECADAAHGLGALVVSDGGCTNPGDIAKAIGAGADLVMLGGMLAGHDESGGNVVERVCLATGPQPPKAQRGGRRGRKGEAPLVDTDLTGAAAGAAAAAAAAALSANEANQDDDDDDDDGEGDDDGEEGEERPEGGSGRSRGRGGRGRRMVRGETVPLTPKTVPLTTGSSSTDAPLSTSNPLLVTRTFKEFYGMSSAVAMSRHHGGVAEYRASEGKAILCPYRGPVERTMQDILGGLRSACTYVGAAEVKDLSKRTTFIRVTQQTNDVFGVERE